MKKSDLRYLKCAVQIGRFKFSKSIDLNYCFFDKQKWIFDTKLLKVSFWPHTFMVFFQTFTRRRFVSTLTNIFNKCQYYKFFSVSETSKDLIWSFHFNWKCQNNTFLERQHRFYLFLSKMIQSNTLAPFHTEDPN